MEEVIPGQCILSKWENEFENLIVRAHIGGILDQIIVHIYLNSTFIGCFFNST